MWTYDMFNNVFVIIPGFRSKNTQQQKNKNQVELHLYWTWRNVDCAFWQQTNDLYTIN